ncbi:DUF4148 domain-containing protein [Trinickia sp. LjRoot230]|uniref:DUF4148 domain-containing protein n=1 Tax=Trinickia sp. LjRoot230 TaxID=3342288 RepID=UPI003ECE9864
MKSLIYAVVAASALATPLVSMAQTESNSNQPVTRAQVQQDLLRVEQAGYRPGSDDPSYPADIQAAEQRAAGEQGQSVAARADTSGYGGTANESSQSGAPSDSRPMNVDGVHPLYFGR